MASTSSAPAARVLRSGGLGGPGGCGAEAQGPNAGVNSTVGAISGLCGSTARIQAWVSESAPAGEVGKAEEEDEDTLKHANNCARFQKLRHQVRCSVAFCGPVAAAICAIMSGEPLFNNGPDWKAAALFFLVVVMPALFPLTWSCCRRFPGRCSCLDPHVWSEVYFQCLVFCCFAGYHLPSLAILWDKVALASITVGRLCFLIVFFVAEHWRIYCVLRGCEVVTLAFISVIFRISRGVPDKVESAHTRASFAAWPALVVTLLMIRWFLLLRKHEPIQYPLKAWFGIPLNGAPEPDKENSMEACGVVPVEPFKASSSNSSESAEPPQKASSSAEPPKSPGQPQEESGSSQEWGHHKSSELMVRDISVISFPGRIASQVECSGDRRQELARVTSPTSAGMSDEETNSINSPSFA